MKTAMQERWSAQMLSDWKSIRGMVIKSAALMNHSREVDDVMQDVFIIADKKLESFDENRGSFRGWLMGIAYNRLRQKVDDTSVNLRALEALKSRAVHEDMLNSDPHADLLATDVIMRVDLAFRLSEVMALVAVVEDEVLFDRSMVLLRNCGGNVQQASVMLGVSAAALRDTHRQVMDMAKVVDNALSLHYVRSSTGVSKALSVGELLSCFPDPEDSDRDREWLRKVPVAVFRAGGWNVEHRELIAAVSEDTGYSFTTARHAVARCFRLFMVARTIAETGTL